MGKICGIPCLGKSLGFLIWGNLWDSLFGRNFGIPSCRAQKCKGNFLQIRNFLCVSVPYVFGFPPRIPLWTREFCYSMEMEKFGQELLGFWSCLLQEFFFVCSNFNISWKWESFGDGISWILMLFSPRIPLWMP